MLALDQVWRTRYGQLNLEKTRLVTGLTLTHVTYRSLGYPAPEWGEPKTVQRESFMRWAAANRAAP